MIAQIIGIAVGLWALSKAKSNTPGTPTPNSTPTPGGQFRFLGPPIPSDRPVPSPLFLGPPSQIFSSVVPLPKNTFQNSNVDNPAAPWQAFVGDAPPVVVEGSPTILRQPYAPIGQVAGVSGTSSAGSGAGAGSGASAGSGAGQGSISIVENPRALSVFSGI